jgi:dTDP-glucose 4,6-dehydratase
VRVTPHPLDGATVLVAGGAGFIGSNFVHRLLGPGRTARVTVLDALTYAGNLENHREFLQDPRFRFVKGDIADAAAVLPLVEAADYVINFAAETHVDRSIRDQSTLVRANVEGPLTLLNAARQHPVRRFVHVGTDEVYGEVLGPAVDEEAPLRPRNPYSATKAGGDALALAYRATFGLPVVVTRASNNYGPYQYPEKMIPLFLTNAMEDRELPLYGDGRHRRDWIHVTDHCRALEMLLTAPAEAVDGEIFNIAGGEERENREIAAAILDAVGKPHSLIRPVTDRPGHDRRYAMSAEKIRTRIGFAPEMPLARGIVETVRWYGEHRTWWERIKSGAFRDYYAEMYSGR